MGCCGLCATKKDLGKVFGCIPLSLFALLFAIFEIVYPSWQIYEAVTSTIWRSTSGYISLALSCVHILVGVLAIIAIALSWAPGITFLSKMIKFTIFAYIFSLLSLWFFWIARMVGYKTKKWNPDKNDIVLMSVTTALMFFVMVMAWYIMSCFASLGMVMRAGGTGWERLNYKQIKTGDKTIVRSDTDDSSV